MGGFWLAVVWTVALSTAGGCGFYQLTVRRHGVTHTSALLHLTPPTTVWALVMFGQAPGGTALAGMAVSAAGVAAATLRTGTASGDTTGVTRTTGPDGRSGTVPEGRSLGGA